MHKEIIREIHKLNRQLADQDIYMGGRGFYKVLEPLPIIGPKTKFYCYAMQEAKKYVIEFAPDNVSHVELQKYLRRALFLLVLDHKKKVISGKDFSIDPLRCFVILDWVPGPNLRFILRNSRLTINQALWIALDVIEALQHLADFAFVHRNIDPQNITIKEKSGEAYLGGFEYITQSDFLQTKLQLHTQYVAPELMRSLLFPEETIFLTPASDIYSLGAVLYYMITGNPPFGSKRNLEKWSKRPNIPKISDPTMSRNEKKYFQQLMKYTMHPRFDKRWNPEQIASYIQEYLKDSQREEDLADLF